MRYEDRFDDRHERRDRARNEDYGQADFSDNRRSWQGREDREFSRQHDRDRDRELDREEHRAWAPFGETGPTRYGHSGYDTGQFDRNERFDQGPRYGYDRGYRGGSGQGRGRDAGFGETGGRYSESFGRERYGERDQWGSNPRGGAGNDARNWFDKASDKLQGWLGDEDAQRRSRWDEVRAGSHRGRGPKGYRRSDERIRDDVSDRLSDDSWLDASDIEVKVESCEVTLTGLVQSREDKRRAETLAEDVSGVDHVQNNLRVRREGDRSMFGDGSSATDTSLSGSTGSGRA